jgi:hypothetical protein
VLRGARGADEGAPTPPPPRTRQALLVLPKTLAVNAAKDATELVAKLRAFHHTAQVGLPRWGRRAARERSRGVRCALRLKAATPYRRSLPPKKTSNPMPQDPSARNPPTLSDPKPHQPNPQP